MPTPDRNGLGLMPNCEEIDQNFGSNDFQGDICAQAKQNVATVLHQYMKVIENMFSAISKDSFCSCT